jgi:hypothetical protein
MKDHLNEALEKYLQYVKSKFAYGIMESQQIARTNIELIDMSGCETDTRLLVKHNAYHDLFNKVYFKVPGKFLVPGERLKQSEIKRYRYKLCTIRELTQNFGSSIDVFHNGLKIPYSDIRIAIYDFYFIVELPIKYRTHVSLNVLLRPYVYDETFTTNNIFIDKIRINKIDDNDDFFFYVDGKLVDRSSLTITETATQYNIRSSVTGTKYEVNYIRHLNYYGSTTIRNNHINIMDVKRSFPIPAHNIMTFSNGLLINLGLHAKTDGVYECDINVGTDIKLFYVYRDYPNENLDYNDQYRWFANYIDNFMTIVDSPSLLPEFINNFSLYRRDISLQDFLAKGYSDNKTYNIDVSIDTIHFCEECLMDIIKFIIAEYVKDNQFSVTSDHTNLATLGKLTLKRNNNRLEITDPQYQADFNVPMMVLKIPNINEYPFMIYSNGIRFYDHDVKYREFGIDYVYIDYNKIPDDAFIEVETFNTKYTSLRNNLIVTDGTNNIRIINAKATNFIKDGNDTKYIKLAIENGTRFIYSDNIKSVLYDETTDVLTITLNTIYPINTLLKVYNINFYKKYQYTTRADNTGLDFTLDWLEGAVNNVEHIRVFKNGKEVPRTCYTIEFPNSSNTLTSPKIHINVTYGIYELIDVDFTPTRFKETYYKRQLLEDGLIDLYNTTGVSDKFINDISEYFTLNGVRITPLHYKIWGSKGLAIKDYNTVDYFTTIMKTDDLFEKYISVFVDAYRIHLKLLDKYLVTLMKASVYDSNGEIINPHPIKPGDNPVDDIDPSRYGKLYSDLYNEFLKLNIINASAKIPDYIIIKYGGLIDADTQVLKIDANKQMLSWMPLDANNGPDADAYTRKILDLYYELLDNFESTYILDPSQIPAELYDRYRELLDNGTLILQLPTL